MRLAQLIAATLAGLSGIGMAKAEPTAESTRFELVYHISYGGIPAGRVTVVGQLSAAAYDIRATTRSIGPLDLLLGFRSDAHSSGARVAAALTPAAHHVDNLWRGEPRSVRIAYGPLRSVAATTVPSAHEDGREPVAARDQAGTLDPISAGLTMALNAGEGSPCGTRIDVFDGRRLYAFVPSDGGKTLPPSADEPSKTVCAYNYVRLGGRSDDPWLPRAETPKAGRFEFAELDTRLPPLARRITAWAGPAQVVIRLKGYAIDGGPMVEE